MAHTQSVVHTANLTQFASPAESVTHEFAFQVPLDEGVTVVRTGRELPEAFRHTLLANGARTWAFVSACNPHSLELTPEANLQRHATLCQLLEDEGYQFIHAGLTPLDGVASGVLIFNVSPARAGQFARAFAQRQFAAGDDRRCEALVCEALDFVI